MLIYGEKVNKNRFVLWRPNGDKKEIRVKRGVERDNNIDFLTIGPA